MSNKNMTTINTHIFWCHACGLPEKGITDRNDQIMTRILIFLHKWVVH